jgi:hypothetical protein
MLCHCIDAWLLADLVQDAGCLLDLSRTKVERPMMIDAMGAMQVEGGFIVFSRYW